MIEKGLLMLNYEKDEHLVLWRFGAMASFSKRFSQVGAHLEARGNSQPWVQASTHLQVWS
jgi:hypothetical protein